MKNPPLNLTTTILLGGALLAWNNLWAAPQSCSRLRGPACCSSATAPAASACPRDATIEEQAANEASSVESGGTTFTPAAQEVLQNYLIIQDRLATDTLKDVSKHAGILVASALRGPDLPSQILRDGKMLGAAEDLPTARQAFKALSTSLIRYSRIHESPIGYVEVYCDMSKAGWLQAGAKVRNPYYGSSVYGLSMLDCGTIRRVHGNIENKEG